MFKFFILFIAILGMFLLSTKFIQSYLTAWFLGFPYPTEKVIIENNIMIPMRDGIKLASDLYRPKTPGKYPVIILRTPYGKRSESHYNPQLAKLFAAQGYNFILQDVRGKFDSQGYFFPYENEALDGYDTVEWAGKSSWSNGNVAMIGFSYAGSCAWLAASQGSKYLKTIIPLFTGQNIYRIWIDRGVPYLKDMLFWQSSYEGRRSMEISHDKINEILGNLPINNLDFNLTGHKIRTFQEYISHTAPGQYWEKISVDKKATLMNLPVLFFAGLYDPFLQSTIDDYTRMLQAPLQSKNHKSKIVIGPWAHDPLQKFKEMDFGPKGSFKNYVNHILVWLEEFLKEQPQPEETAKVTYFITGKNEWNTSSIWPPKNSKGVKYFLSPQKLAKSPLQETKIQQYRYDPRDPVISLGSHTVYGNGLDGPREQNFLYARKDVLVYTTEPLEKEVLAAGHAKIILYISTSAMDTDFCAKITDVDTQGKSYYLHSGMIRMAFKDSLQDPENIIPGKIYRIVISLRTLSHAFLKGHKIQVLVTSSDFPHHDRNLNTGKNSEFTIESMEALQSIHMGGEYDSHLLLEEV
jgi:uncharacterized protein